MLTYCGSHTPFHIIFCYLFNLFTHILSFVLRSIPFSSYGPLITHNTSKILNYKTSNSLLQETAIGHLSQVYSLQLLKEFLMLHLHLLLQLKEIIIQIRHICYLFYTYYDWWSNCLKMILQYRANSNNFTSTPQMQ